MQSCEWSERGLWRENIKVEDNIQLNEAVSSVPFEGLREHFLRWHFYSHEWTFFIPKTVPWIQAPVNVWTAPEYLIGNEISIMQLFTRYMDTQVSQTLGENLLTFGKDQLCSLAS